MKRLALPATAWWLLGLLPVSQAFAQARDGCQINIDELWQRAPASTLYECLAQLDTLTQASAGKGMRYGQWQGQPLAVDAFSFYLSSDGGRSYKLLMSKADLPHQLATPEDAFAVDREAPPIPQPTAPPAAPSPSATATTAPATPSTAAAFTPPEPLFDPARLDQPGQQPCTVHNTAYERTYGAMSLADCAQMLDRSANLYDGNGYKYASWGERQLIADRSSLLVDDPTSSSVWVGVMQRSGH